MSADASGQTADALRAEELQRKYRHIQSNKEDWAEHAQKELKRQKNEIADLKKDNEQLRQQLAQAQGSPFNVGGVARPGTAVATGSTGKRIQKVKEIEGKKELLSNLDSKAEVEEQKIAQLDTKIASLEEKVHEARGNMGGINVTKESNQMIEKQIKVLENRLDKALVKFNEALHINKELREQIDNLRRERGVFDTIYKKLERELQEKKKEMAFIIEVSNIAYEERDNAQTELGQLKLYASKEMQSFEETFKELDELLEEDRRMKEAIKSRMNEKKDKLDKSVSEEEKSKRKAAGALSARASITQLTSSANAGPEMTPQNYEEAFNKIRAATNMSDINQLVQKFLHAEDDNFSLFNYVNELNNEIEKLEDARNEIRAELERVKGHTGSQGDPGRKALLKQLEEKLQQEEANSKKYDQMATRTSKLLEQIIVCVDKIFNTLECDEHKIIEQQGTAGITENSLHLYLAAIELKADEYLTRWRRLHGHIDKGPSFPFGGTNISIDVPSTGDDYGDGYSDEEERVLTREELLMKTTQKISKQQQQGQDSRKGTKKGKKKFPMLT
eukprot:TRINITY_DN2439_c0_g1_i1.p1 TRINITY_DN2439_c0_g1~~TRINITY_DN2439_c0_g1_i1.p1  ORF type:complete len:560 (-),score=155.92 TRINITY_DN2439_c0_g1_i1:93-1772(-)